MRNSTIIALFSLVCVACKVDFDFSGLDSAPILYLDMNLDYDTQDGRWQYLNGFVYAVPSAAGEREFPEDLCCRMEVYHNSALVWSRDDIRLQTFEGLVSADIEGVSPGDELKVVAQAEGFPAASAKATVPQSPPPMTVSHSRINKSKFRIGITIEDDPQTEDSYAFTFEKAHWYEGSLQPSGVDRLEPSFGSTEETSFLDLGPFDVIWEDGDKFYGISDREFNGQNKTIEINVDYPLSDDAFYRIAFYRVSPERLRYEIACQDKGSNILGFIGLAPATFAYSNVIGGTGCISCSSVFRTDWMPVPVE